jgi:hypothetical protein
LPINRTRADSFGLGMESGMQVSFDRLEDVVRQQV